ncbi:MAG: cupredoxin domain-containing protein [Acidimicrobiales bacterium]
MSQRQRQESMRRRQRRTKAAIVAGVAAVLALGGILLLPISDDGDRADRPAVEISMVEYAYAPVDASVEPGQELSITNDGAIVHSYLVADLGKGLELEPGDAGTVQIPTDAAPDTYAVICDIPGHVDLGMVGTLVVKAPAPESE